VKGINMFDSYDEFDLALALYHFLQHNWDGESDPLYRDFCALTAPGMFKPGMSAEYFENIDDTAKEVYDQLTIENYSSALAKVLNYSSEDSA
jgi:hypothetical protein